jgi:threonine dehydratase
MSQIAENGLAAGARGDTGPVGSTADGAMVTIEEITDMALRLRPHIRHTPCIELRAAELGLSNCRVTLKLEHLQHSGSFKARGAFGNLLKRSVPAVGVVAASGGNHGVAVAYAAKQLDVRAKIFVPIVSSPSKIFRIHQYGAELVVGGADYAAALEASEAWTRQTGGMPVHAFDQRETLLGTGSLGMELEGDVPDLTAVLASVGGGGLVGGIAAWYRNRLAVVGVEPENSPTATHALHAGYPIDAPASGLALDSLAPRRVGRLVFPILRDFVDRVVLVADDEIRHAQRVLWELVRVVAEPGGACAFASLLSGRYRPLPGAHVGVVVSGGNTTAVDFDCT